MRRLIRRLTVGMAVAGILLFGGTPPSVQAKTPYDTYAKDPYGEARLTPPAYSPAGVIGRDIYIPDEEGVLQYAPLAGPQDLDVGQSGRIFVADTGNNRIVEFDEEGEFVRVIAPADHPLKGPRGVFAANDGSLYVADTGNGRVVQLGPEGNVLNSYGRPESAMLPAGTAFEPTGIAVDDRGFMYVVLNGSYQGVMQLGPDGQYRGFVGTNSTEASWQDRIQRLLYTKEQLSRQVRLLPAPIRSIEIDELGYLYTVSGSGSEQVKKLNIRGDNLWGSRSFGEQVPEGGSQATGAASSGESGLLADIAVDRSGNATVIDKSRNVVLQYDADGRLLFFWAGRVTAGMPKVGLNQSPVAVATDSEQRLLILDDSLNVIQVFAPTRFGTAVHTAHELTREGKYAESKRYWSEVAKLDARYAPAYRGLGDAAYSEEDYAEAMKLYRLAGEQNGYSDAFWQLRLAWFQARFPWIANALIAMFLLSVAIPRIRKVVRPRRRLRLPWASWRRPKLLDQLKHVFVILRHPLDGFSDLRYAEKGGWLSGIVLIGAAVAVLPARTYLTSFTFDPVLPELRTTGPSLIAFAGVWLSWIICNYLIGSIYRGEARFRDVFTGSAYAMFPTVLLGLPLALLSNAMTLSEASIYGTLEGAVAIWCGLLFFWSIQSLQNYSVGETVTNILLTAVAMAMLWMLAFILFGLAGDLLDFAKTVYLEVSM